MRINGEITPQEEEEKGEAKNGAVVDTTTAETGVVGYALTSKKKKSFLQPKLEVLARPLSDQGPFDVILHKVSVGLCVFCKTCRSTFTHTLQKYAELSGKDWCEVIEDYQQKHLEAIVLDPPDAIQHLHNRQSMLQDVADLDLSDCQGKVCVPRQMVVNKDPSSIPREVTKAGLKLPLVAKPLVVDGTAKSHELFLAYDEFSLSELEPPLVLQEFVNHGGVLFKIYVVGEAIKVVRRFSLPNISKCELAKVAGVFRFPRVSSAASSADDVDLDPSVGGSITLLNIVDFFFSSVIVSVHDHKFDEGLRLFNIDMIREHGTQDVFYVIDINYFPGKRNEQMPAHKTYHNFTNLYESTRS
ncbi:hypothetical protein GH714_009104 [Hevea brasiliensis]|uniref:Inositol-tetrakisphosphate 1-kinase n=1 Tax=Hevea brasiliensis TaxID=3981 RepID=A0A6A6L200_HEVBR|nr:hypothetical protein GH714_009104 [Hevea brasiliensis]